MRTICSRKSERRTFDQHAHPLLGMPSCHHYQQKHCHKKLAHCTFWKRGNQFGKVAIFYNPCQSSPLLQKKALRYFYIWIFATFSYLYFTPLSPTRYSELAEKKAERRFCFSRNLSDKGEGGFFAGAALIVLNQKQEFQKTVNTY